MEACLLTMEEKVELCGIVSDSGAGVKPLAPLVKLLIFSH